MNFYPKAVTLRGLLAPKERETDVQSAAIQWWKLAHRGLGVPFEELLFSIPNGAFFGGGQTAGGQKLSVVRYQKLKREGLRPGAPDLFLAVARAGNHGLFVEVKTEDGRVSPEQEAFRLRLFAQNYRVVVAFGFDEIVSAVTEYLKS